MQRFDRASRFQIPRPHARGLFSHEAAERPKRIVLTCDDFAIRERCGGLTRGSDVVIQTPGAVCPTDGSGRPMDWLVRILTQRRSTELALCGHSPCDRFRCSHGEASQAGGSWYERTLRRRREAEDSAAAVQDGILRQARILLSDPRIADAVSCGRLVLRPHFYAGENGSLREYDGEAWIAERL